MMSQNVTFLVAAEMMTVDTDVTSVGRASQARAAITGKKPDHQASTTGVAVGIRRPTHAAVRKGNISRSDRAGGRRLMNTICM